MFLHHVSRHSCQCWVLVFAHQACNYNWEGWVSFSRLLYLVVKRWTSQSFGSTNINVCAGLKLQSVLVHISLKTMDMGGESREVRDYSGALIAISKNNCFCPRIGFWFWSEQSWMYITFSFLHKWLKRSRKLKVLLTDLPFQTITCMLSSTTCFQ